MTARLDALSGGAFAAAPRYARESDGGQRARQVAKLTARNHNVDDQALEGRKRRASLKGAVPTVQLYVRTMWSRKVEPTYNFELLNGDDPWIDRIAQGLVTDGRLSLRWDFSRLVFNAEELDVVRLAHVQRILVTDALAAYFDLQRFVARSKRGSGPSRVRTDVTDALDGLDREQLEATLRTYTGEAELDSGSP